jgi:hypothetical protein
MDRAGPSFQRELSMKRIAPFLILAAVSMPSWAASAWDGTWLLRSDTPGFKLTMTIEEVGPSWKITYRIPAQDPRGNAITNVLTVQSPLDGKEVPVLVDGKPSGQTMQIRKLDSNHTFTVVKFQGKQAGVSKSELSADGKSITTENDFSSNDPKAPSGKQMQYWEKQ